MSQDILVKLKDTFRVLVDLELTIGDYYKTCAEKWPQDEVFWTEIYKQEQEHAESIEKMSEMISKSPDKFILGRSFNPVAIGTIISELGRIVNSLTLMPFPSSKHYP